MASDLERRLGIGRTPWWLISGSVGAAWGLIAYAVLWGLTPIVIHRPFVLSVAGTIILLPARLVLWGINVAEDAAGRSFALSDNHGWIGLLAGLSGAVTVLLVTVAARALLHRFGGSGTRGRRAPIVG